MMKQIQTTKKTNNIILFIKIIGSALLVLFVASRIRFLLVGPSLSITRPKNGSTVLVGITTLQGTARTATSVFISGISVPIDTNGVFAYDIYVPPGLTKIPITVKNTYGKSRTMDFVVWGEELKKTQ